jgi:alpha-tubulin suppressor-like RCC1 family protein
VPVTVTTGAGTALLGVTQISAGSTHTCAVLNDRTARCWGIRNDGRLGDNTIAGESRVPAIVTTGAGTALLGVTQISAGGSHTCAVLDDGTARCWGLNTSGQLGNDSVVSSSVPVTVTTGAGTALLGVAQISAGTNHTCAVIDGGMARCWGLNSSGRLGDGTTTTPRRVPVAVVNFGNPGWPATVTVSVTDSAGRTSSANVTLTYQ